ncbi:NPCBM/NEW2 domain-containing protein [Kibdelosporangium philippinense]|nr:NPCBM/NEW2 domain-containing protein [Kibdelosporangium philippinense]
MFRVNADRGWAKYPPAVDTGAALQTAYPGALPLVEPGDNASVTTSATNNGRAPAMTVKSELTGPAGWEARPESPNNTASLRTGESLNTKWLVKVPASAKPGLYVLTVRTTFRSDAEPRFDLEVRVPPPAPRTNAYVSDLTWLSSDNGWGPVERDTSNGEADAGDGNPMTINGVTFAKGIGAHAPSNIEFYVGGRCTSLAANVGVDDEEGADGSVGFEVWANGAKIADSGVMTNAMPAKPISADITGAMVVRLVVNDGGNGITSDHGDWADLRVTCA